MKYLKKIKPDKKNEIQLSDAIDLFIKNGESVYAFKLEGEVYDCGNKLGYSIANVEFSKKDPEIGSAFRKYLKKSV